MGKKKIYFTLECIVGFNFYCCIDQVRYKSNSPTGRVLILSINIHVCHLCVHSFKKECFCRKINTWNQNKGPCSFASPSSSDDAQQMFLQKSDVGDLPPAPTHLFAINRNCFLKRKFVHRKRDRVILLWNHVIPGWFCTIYFPEFLNGCFLSIFICWQQTCLVIGLICVSWNHWLAQDPHVLDKCYKTSSLEQSHCIYFSFWEYLNPGNFINNSIRNSGKFRYYVSESFLYFEPGSVQSHQCLRICLNISYYVITPVIFTKRQRNLF